jgi:hypothetical protein
VVNDHNRRAVVPGNGLELFFGHVLALPEQALRAFKLFRLPAQAKSEERVPDFGLPALRLSFGIVFQGREVEDNYGFV